MFGFLNERTLFSTQWQFRKNNVAPAEYERQMREVAYPALERLKEQCLRENILRPAIVYGFFPCAAAGDELVIYEPGGATERLRFTFPRQDHGDYLCLSDYYRPADNGGASDVVAFMAVTVGPEVTRRAWELKDTGAAQMRGPMGPSTNATPVATDDMLYVGRGNPMGANSPLWAVKAGAKDLVISTPVPNRVAGDTLVFFARRA